MIIIAENIRPIQATKYLPVLSVLAYFSVFRHPLKLSEIHELLHFSSATEIELKEQLDLLVNEEIIQQKEEYYFIEDETSIEKRISGESNAAKCQSKAAKCANLISKFPFVRAVFVTGSLSKNYMDSKSDIDYFIITQPNRLWLCRTLLMLYKKVFLFNSHRYFCINYFVDTNNLLISDQTVFTATELLFVKPYYNLSLYSLFIDSNKWAFNFYPNKSLYHQPVIKEHQSIIKNYLEKFFSLSVFNLVDDFFLKITVKYWSKKFANTNLSFDEELRSYKGVSKHHPNSYENTIMKKYQKNLMALEEKLNAIID